MREYGENIKRGSLNLSLPFSIHLMFIHHSFPYHSFFSSKQYWYRHTALDHSQKLSTMGPTHTGFSIALQKYLPSLLTRSFNTCILPLLCPCHHLFHFYNLSCNTVFPGCDLPALGAQLLRPSPWWYFPGAGYLLMHASPTSSLKSFRNEHNYSFPSLPLSHLQCCPLRIQVEWGLKWICHMLSSKEKFQN